MCLIFIGLNDKLIAEMIKVFGERKPLPGWKKQVFLALLVAIGIILHLVEASLPALFFIPGAKLGLANIVTLIALTNFGFAAALQVLLLRILVASLLSGTFMTVTFFLSLTGGLVGFWLMNLAYQYLRDRFSLVGISIIGAFGHNFGQLLMAFYFIQSSGLFYYFPYLILAALPTGFFVGVLALILNPYLERFFLPGTIKRGYL